MIIPFYIEFERPEDPSWVKERLLREMGILGIYIGPSIEDQTLEEIEARLENK